MVRVVQNTILPLKFINFKKVNYEKKSISLLPQHVASLEKIRQVMSAAHYASRSIEFYVRELRFLFEYYPEVLPSDITETHITQYMIYVKDVLQCGRDK
ncbi:MAG: hypothetical protein WKF97_05130, partial [Chitinophagaceae bacterium]